ncbi:MAG TPA: acetate kinase [Tepidisphaeraceae bacterium]|jgi:acetate kinase
MNVLVLNAGSSSLKFRLLHIERADAGSAHALADGIVEKWGTPDAALRLTVEGHPPEHRSVAAESSRDAAEHAIQACLPFGIDAIGHRVVHGGARYEQPTRITRQVIEGIREVSHLAPLHNALAIAGMEAGWKLLPKVAAVAVFDTAFHRTLPPVAFRYALPLEWAEQHDLRRFGFHGISHRYVSGKLLECLGRPAAGTRLITCHLGNGSSLCAVRDGQSIETSMGLTPMEGLIMGTRSGDVDPGLVLHLMDELKMTVREVDDLLNRRSGLLGLSGRSGDVRDMEQAAQSGDARAEAALESFAYRARKYLGAYAAVLGGVDAIAFAGGIGEHSAGTRQRIVRGLEFLGMYLDAARNAAVPKDDPARISTRDSRVAIWVIPTNEELQIAREVFGLLSDPPRE